MRVGQWCGQSCDIIDATKEASLIMIGIDNAQRYFNALPQGECGCDLRCVNFKHPPGSISSIRGSLVDVNYIGPSNGLSRQTPSHYLSVC